MLVLDPVLDYVLSLGEDRLAVGIDKNIHELVNVCIGQTHNHSRFELHALLEGSLRVDVEDSTFAIRGGQAALIGPQQHHRIQPDGPDFRRVTIGITPLPGALCSAMTERVGPYRVLELEPEVVEILHSIVEESRIARPFHEELIRMQLARLVILLLRQLEVTDPGGSTPDKDRDRTLDIIDNYFESNLAQNPCADDLADRLHISRRHLNRILQKTYGMSFRDKLLRARMDRAAWLLRHTENSVSAIAGEVGYTYDSAFRQAFRGQFRMTPMEYRQYKRKDETNESDHSC